MTMAFILSWFSLSLSHLSLWGKQAAIFLAGLWQCPHGEELKPPANSQKVCQQPYVWAWKWLLQPQSGLEKTIDLANSLTEISWGTLSQNHQKLIYICLLVISDDSTIQRKHIILSSIVLFVFSHLGVVPPFTQSSTPETWESS